MNVDVIEFYIDEFCCSVNVERMYVIGSNYEKMFVMIWKFVVVYLLNICF